MSIQIFGFLNNLNIDVLFFLNQFNSAIMCFISDLSYFFIFAVLFLSYKKSAKHLALNSFWMVLLYILVDNLKMLINIPRPFFSFTELNIISQSFSASMISSTVTPNLASASAAARIWSKSRAAPSAAS